MLLGVGQEIAAVCDDDEARGAAAVVAAVLRAATLDQLRFPVGDAAAFELIIVWCARVSRLTLGLAAFAVFTCARFPETQMKIKIFWAVE